MSIDLPEIEVEKIKDTALAKKVVQLFSVIEAILQENKRLQGQVEELRTEIVKLKGLPRKPSFSSGDRSVSKKLAGKKREWSKSSKKEEVQIGREVDLAEVEECSCGSRKFRILRTIEKVVRWIIIRRNNILYRGRDKECVVCGKVHNVEIPAWTHLKIWGIKIAEYLHSDATGIKRKLKGSGEIINQYIHFVRHKFLSIFQMERVRMEED